MSRYWILAIAVAIATVLAAPLTASAASNVLTVGGTSGAAVAVGDVLLGTSTDPVFQNASGSEKVKCASSHVTAIVETNPTAPGVATFAVPSVTFSPPCPTTGLFGATVNGIATNASSACPWNASLNDTTSPATLTVTPATAGGSCSPVISAALSLAVVGQTFVCNYTAANNQLSGTVSLGSGAAVGFSSQQFNGASGNSSLCFTPGFFTATYTFVDQTQNNGAVFVN